MKRASALAVGVMTRSRVLALACVVLVAAFAGCALAPGEAAVVPEDELRERNWAEKDSSDFAAVQGAVKVFVREYESQSSFAGMKFPGGIHLATAPDVPVVDESEFAEEQVLRLVRNQGFDLGDRVRENFEIADGRVVSSSVFTVEKDGGEGKLRVVPIPCRDAKSFVLGVGWGASSVPPGSRAPFADASALLGTVECPG